MSMGEGRRDSTEGDGEVTAVEGEEGEEGEELEELGATLTSGVVDESDAIDETGGGSA